MDLRKLKTLIDLVSESNISELEITEAEGKVRIVKALAALSQAPTLVAAAPLLVPAAAAGPVAVAAEPAAAPAGKVIKSPMVGTFYRAPSPEAPPFASVGDQVDMHGTICIIEAMKVMNEITPDVAGTVVSIEVENGEAVEFGQTLFLIRKN
jgi:acetyl-CoA carboxylase biotin carboxyl carrier protein